MIDKYTYTGMISLLIGVSVYVGLNEYAGIAISCFGLGFQMAGVFK